MSRFRTVYIADAVTEDTANVNSRGELAVLAMNGLTPQLNLRFINPDPPNFTTLTADTVLYDTVISVASVTGMSAGTTIGLTNPAGIFYFGEVISIATLDVTLDTPLDNVFPSADTNVIIGSTHLNVAGTLANPVVFQIGGGEGGIDIDITRVMGNMIDGTAMTDATFGGLAALTNGIVLRHVNGTVRNIWNMKSNGAIALMCFDAFYPDKVPAGVYAFRFRNTFAGQSKHGVAVRIEAGETLELLVQDDLTGLDDFQMMAQGHIVGG